MKNLLKKIKFTGTGLMFQAAQFVPLAPLNAKPGSNLTNIYASGDLSAYISNLFLFGISIGAIIAVVRLMWAGYQYMGSEMWTSKEHAKTIFREVIFGLLLLLSIWLILYKINPELLNIKILTSIQKSQSADQQAPSGTEVQGTQSCGGDCSYCDKATGQCLVSNN